MSGAAPVEIQTADPSERSERDAVDALASANRRRGLLFVGLAVAGVGFAITLQLGLNANFVGEELKFSATQQGVLEAFRESCGVIALFILAALAGLAEPIIAAIMLAFLALGLSAYARISTFGWLVVASLVWSQGFHVWVPLPNSMTMALAEPGQTGRRLGQIAAAGAAGSAGGLLLALVLHHWGVAIRPLWLLAAGAALLASVACLAIPRRIKTPGQRFVIRRRYGLYYLLCFLEGWRKQIFIAFAGFLLVKQYHTSLSTMLLLWLTTQVIGWFSSPFVGRLIDRYGERPLLVVYYTGLVGIFIGYAFVPIRGVLFTLFILDGALFVLAMALTTYVSRIAPTSEHTPTLSAGVAFNHVAAVCMPLVGGLLWKYTGYRWAFLLGALVASLSVLVAWRLPDRIERLRGEGSNAESSSPST